MDSLATFEQITKTSFLNRLAKLKLDLRNGFKECNRNIKTENKIKRQLIKLFKIVEKSDIEERLKFYARVTRNAQRARKWEDEKKQLFAIQKSAFKLTKQVKKLKLTSVPTTSENKLNHKYKGTGSTNVIIDIQCCSNPKI